MLRGGQWAISSKVELFHIDLTAAADLLAVEGEVEVDEMQSHVGEVTIPLFLLLII
jgi:hypothetical protein